MPSFLYCSAICMNVSGIRSAIPMQRTILLALVDFGFIKSPPVFSALVLSFVVALKPSMLTVSVPFNFVCLNISFELFTPQR